MITLSDIIVFPLLALFAYIAFKQLVILYRQGRKADAIAVGIAMTILVVGVTFFKIYLKFHH